MLNVKNFGVNLKRIRELEGVQVKTLSEITGLTAKTINNYESGRHEPGLHAVITISAALNVPINKMCEENYWREYEKQDIP